MTEERRRQAAAGVRVELLLVADAVRNIRRLARVAGLSDDDLQSALDAQGCSLARTIGQIEADLKAPLIGH
jgi:DNA-binding phage protein